MDVDNNNNSFCHLSVFWWNLTRSVKNRLCCRCCLFIPLCVFCSLFYSEHAQLQQPQLLLGACAEHQLPGPLHEDGDRDWAAPQRHHSAAAQRVSGTGFQPLKVQSIKMLVSFAVVHYFNVSAPSMPIHYHYCCQCSFPYKPYHCYGYF